MIHEGRPTDILEAEHHSIRQVVAAMAVRAEQLELGRAISTDSLRDIVEFMRTFGDRCHHGKEERLLFPLLERKGVPIQGCPLGILVHEHERGRALVTELAQSAEAYAGAEPEARERLQKCLHGLTELYPGHMWREEYLLFPMTEKILSQEEMDELRTQFALVESEIGAGVHERLEQLAVRLGDEVYPPA